MYCKILEKYLKDFDLRPIVIQPTTYGFKLEIMSVYNYYHIEYKKHNEIYNFEKFVEYVNKVFAVFSEEQIKVWFNYILNSRMIEFNKYLHTLKLRRSNVGWDLYDGNNLLQLPNERASKLYIGTVNKLIDDYTFSMQVIACEAEMSFRSY